MITVICILKHLKMQFNCPICKAQKKRCTVCAVFDLALSVCREEPDVHVLPDDEDEDEEDENKTLRMLYDTQCKLMSFEWEIFNAGLLRSEWRNASIDDGPSDAWLETMSDHGCDPKVIADCVVQLERYIIGTALTTTHILGWSKCKQLNNQIAPGSMSLKSALIAEKMVNKLIAGITFNSMPSL